MHQWNDMGGGGEVVKDSPDDNARVVAGRAQFAAPGESLRVSAEVLGHRENRVRQACGGSGPHGNTYDEPNTKVIMHACTRSICSVLQ